MSDPASVVPTVDLGGLSKQGLLDYAKQRGVFGVSSAMRKDDILNAIRGAGR